MKKSVKLILIPIAAALCGGLLLLFASLIPTSAIQTNADRSAKYLGKIYPYYKSYVSDLSSYQCDYFTESLIFMEAYDMTIDSPESIVTNPHHVNEDHPELRGKAFEEVVSGTAEPESIYPRYWQGFRAVVRPMMLFADYEHIRLINSAACLGLAALCIAALAYKKRLAASLCLAVSFILVNPPVVSQLLQFSCCFIIAFAAVLAVLIFEKKLDGARAAMLFCIVGCATQFFDFYTTPIVTYGFPAIALLTLPAFENKRLKSAGTTFLSWGYGYVSMWVIKMGITTVFTDMNGFADSFSSFLRRTGNTAETDTAEYTARRAIAEAVKAMFGSKRAAAAALAVLAVLCLAALVVSLIRLRLKKTLNNAAFLAVAALPVIWFCGAKQATVIHAFFQHRGLSVLVLGVLMFASATFSAVLKNKARVPRSAASDTTDSV